MIKKNGCYDTTQLPLKNTSGEAMIIVSHFVGTFHVSINVTHEPPILYYQCKSFNADVALFKA